MIFRARSLRIDADQGLVLDLDNWDHRDYIEDVLAEHFDIDYEYLIEDEKSGKYTLFFCDSAQVSDIEGAIAAINIHHASSTELYEVV
jgi:hypothetical protein